MRLFLFWKSVELLWSVLLQEREKQGKILYFRKESANMI